MSESDKVDEPVPEGSEPTAAAADASVTEPATVAPAATAVLDPPSPDGGETDQVALELTRLGVTDVGVIDKIKNQLGVTTVEDLSVVTEADLLAAGMLAIPARKLASAIAPVASATSDIGTSTFDEFLPSMPSDDSWLEALQTGGVLKIDKSTVIAAVRAALANRVGLFEIPDLLAKAMEEFADTTEEQVDPSFYAISKQLTRKNYAELFAAIDGLDGRFVTAARKKKLLTRIDESLWPELISFNDQLQSWLEMWTRGAVNPSSLMMMMAAGGSGGPMPPGMMQPPDTGGLRDYALTVADTVNKAFAGTGVQIASALAYEATNIKETLANPRLPAMIGAVNRDQMLKQLGVAVSPTYPRLEQDLSRFVLCCMDVKNIPSGEAEYRYFGALASLGSQIDWTQVGGGGRRRRVSGIGGSSEL